MLNKKRRAFTSSPFPAAAAALLLIASFAFTASASKSFIPDIMSSAASSKIKNSKHLMWKLMFIAS
jgi:hypothetical protein